MFQRNRNIEGISYIASLFIILIISIDLLLTSSNRFFVAFSNLNMTMIFMLMGIATLAFIKISVPNYLIIGLIMVIYCFLDTSINRSGTDKAMIQLCILAYFLALYNCKLSKRGIRFIIFINVVVWAIWLINGRNYFTAIFSSGGHVFNSNTIAQILFYTFSNISVFLLEQGKDHKLRINNKIINKPGRVLQIIAFFLTLIVITQCESRTSIIAIIILEILYLMPKERINKKGIIIATILIMAGGLIFPFIYLGLQSNPRIAAWFLNATGKPLYTGRELLWKRLLGDFSDIKILIFGINHSISASAYFMPNLHNTYLTYIYWFGLIGLLLYFAFILATINYTCNLMNEDNRNCLCNCIFTFLVTLVTLYAETTVLWTTFMMIPYFIIAIAPNPEITDKLL